MSNLLDGVTALEQTAATLRDRLNPDRRQQVIGEQVEALRGKFLKDYGVAPPPTMERDIEDRVGGEFDVTVQADLGALKATSETLAAALAEDLHRAEDLPDALTETTRGRVTPLDLRDATAVQLLEEVRVSNLRAELAGAGFARVLGVYKAAVATANTTQLRYLERQAAQHWPGIVRHPDELPEQQQLQALIAATRAARVPADLREAQVRVGKLWSTSFDVLHRTLNGRGLQAV